MAIPDKLRIKVNMIAFLVIAFGLLYGMATQVLSILEGTYSVRAIFPDAGGVFTDQEVTYRGITVGQVGEMKVVTEGVELELVIDEDYKIPAEGTQARVMFKSAVGEQFVDILPGSSGPPYMENGSMISKDRTSIPVSTQSLLSSTQSVLEGVPPQALGETIDSLAAGLAGQGANVARILESTADISELFARRAPEVEGILRNGTTVGDAFLRSSDDFKVAITELVQVADLLADNRGNIEDLLQNSNELSDELVALIRANRGNLNQTIIDLAKINEFQAESADDLRALFKELPGALASVARTFEPKTGLIRFGLVQDDRNPGCDYSNRDRRPPQNRGPKLPPKHAVCSGAVGSSSSGSSSSSSSQAAGPDETAGSGGSLGAPTDIEDLLIPDVDRGRRLPQRMRDWSWAFLYLNTLR
jgi:phospholipid/cholesterol/gamma-HCH transport system substrate-binding protein